MIQNHGLGQRQTFLENNMLVFTKKTAASLKRRKWGLRLPNHLKVLSILTSIWYYILLVLNWAPSKAIILPWLLVPSWGFPIGDAFIVEEIEDLAVIQRTSLLFAGFLPQVFGEPAALAQLRVRPVDGVESSKKGLGQILQQGTIDKAI